MSDLKDDVVSLEDNSASGELADELHVDHTADMEEARGSQSYVQSDNSLTEKHKKKRKRPKYAKRDFPSDSSESESEDYSHRRKKSKATKYVSKSKKSSKKDDFSSDSESDKEVRSVISETISNLTYSDKNGNKSCHRFNPHKKEKTGLQFFEDMELFLDDNFNRFIPSHKVQELILNTMPVPSYEGFFIRSIDPLVFSIMEEQSRSTNTQLDKDFVSIQTKLIDTMGPLGNLWMLFEDIRIKIDKGCDDPSAQAHVDNVDFRHILDLKTICLVGQSNVAINYQRRLSILQRINNQDSKKARSFLRDKQEYLAKNDKHLFGSEFKEELKEWSKTKKEASEMALALGGKKKSHKKKVINYDTPRQV
ncbi:unnamed protein product [Mytilus coruscus]|uniref:Uncharacterized protein n=1 Tax=Mytilus coruscus TaxID=42192 RepID=A0A6J8CAJ5_MYTCO|nr:unnamed protein product [Mytilus coruscus]